MIDLDQLKVGFLYEIDSRNISKGVWDGEGFVGIRTKFGNRFLDKEIHWDLSKNFGTATPQKELVECPIKELRTHLGTDCGNCSANMKYIYWTEQTRPIGNTFPGEWKHLDAPECGKLAPTAISNDALFVWLDSML